MTTTTMTTAVDTDRWAEQVLEEHRELRARVARLREFLPALVAGDIPPEPIDITPSPEQGGRVG